MNMAMKVWLKRTKKNMNHLLCNCKKIIYLGYLVFYIKRNEFLCKIYIVVYKCHDLFWEKRQVFITRKFLASEIF